MKCVMISVMIAAAGFSFVGCGFSFDATEESPRSIAATPGDVNSDGALTMADFELVISYTNWGEEEPDETAADMDGNGHVSNDGLQLLLRTVYPAQE